MISRSQLLADLQRQLATLESDLRAQAVTPGIEDELRSEWESARAANRTGASYVSWRDQKVNQVGAGWLLGTVFLRFCEDNGLIDLPYLAGPGERLVVAAERQVEFFERHPHMTDLDWIAAGFEDISKASPAAAGLFDRAYNPMWQIRPSAEAAKALLTFWRTRGEDGVVVYDFTDPACDTRFLGDLYQDLSEHAKKTYALLTTPEFVEEFILDHTLQPAIEEFGLAQLRIIDPVCGSGHFLLGAFRRLLERWEYEAPAMRPWDRIVQILNGLHGVDKNPFAVSITRFRLMVAAMKAGGARRLIDVPDLRLIVATGDSLLYGRGVSMMTDSTSLSDPSRFYYQRSEDVGEFTDVDLLGAGSYHVVVGNPPYIVPKDKAEAEIYRAIYPACMGTYALTIPFITRFFGLARRGGEQGAGYMGLLSSNSFMKREFGRKLIEQFFPTVDLTDVIDTSGVFIPGHGIPTVILFGRGQRPQHSSIKAILKLRGEPEVPEDPAQGFVWRSITDGMNHIPYEDNWTQGLNIDRSALSSFPWNLAGATTTEILRQIESKVRLGSRVARIGYFANTGSDEVFIASSASFRRISAETEPLIPVITGSGVRDWTAVSDAEGAMFSGVSQKSRDIRMFPRHWRRLWPYRTILDNRPSYSGRSYLEDNRPWYQWYHITETPLAHPWSIIFPWVSTHNHFAVLRENSAPLNSAPVIRLPRTASDADVLQLTALLNSSLICFWLKQYSNSKGQPRADQTGTGEPWTLFYEFTATRLRELPLPADRWSKDRWSVHAEQLDKLAQEVMTADPQFLLKPGTTITGAELDAARSRWEKARARLIGLQEELDWEIYGRYGLVSDADDLSAKDPDSVPQLRPGERAFEIVLARRMAAGEIKTQWFTRHGSTPITVIPSHWPYDYRELVKRRIAAIERRRDLTLIERPEYKRRWATEPWARREKDAIRNWLLDRCEDRSLWYETGHDREPQPRPSTVSGLASRLSKDKYFTAMASRYTGDGSSMVEVIAEITESEHVPYLAAFRYKDAGMRKRQRWEHTWALQREEDISARRADIPTPPRYASADFRKFSYWLNRGKLDMPKERFISYPAASRDGDRPLLLGWAGWSYSERARVLIGLIEDQKRSSDNANGFTIPLLSGLRELIPWLLQWHREPELPFWKDSPLVQVKAYLENELTERGLLVEDLIAWRPPSPKRGRPRKKS